MVATPLQAGYSVRDAFFFENFAAVQRTPVEQRRLAAGIGRSRRRHRTAMRCQLHLEIQRRHRQLADGSNVTGTIAMSSRGAQDFARRSISISTVERAIRERQVFPANDRAWQNPLVEDDDAVRRWPRGLLKMPDTSSRSRGRRARLRRIDAAQGQSTCRVRYPKPAMDAARCQAAAKRYTGLRILLVTGYAAARACRGAHGSSSTSCKSRSRSLRYATGSPARWHRTSLHAEQLTVRPGFAHREA